MKRRQVHRVRGWVLAALAGVLPPALRAQQDPAMYGAWSDPKDLKLTDPSDGPANPMAPVHGILLKTGKVLLVDILHSYPDSTKPNIPDVVIFDPTDENITLAWEESPTMPFPNNHKLYCSGHVVLADGRVVFRGGQNEGPGNAKTTLYDPATNSFVAGPDEFWCLDRNDCPATEDFTKRWYPTLTLLGNGNVLVTDGWRSASYPADGSANTPVVLKVDSGAPSGWQWEVLYDALYCDTDDGSCNTNTPHNFDLNTYPYMFLAGNGNVFLGGSQYGNPIDFFSQKSRKLDVGFGNWVNEFKRDTPLMAASAVLYAKNKVLIAGGATDIHTAGCEATFASKEVYDINIVQSGAQWSLRAEMAQPRLNGHLLSLPDGEILALGGSNDPNGFEVCLPAYHVLAPEKYNPISDGWSVMKEATVPRGHHSVALLLPDGSVFHGGGDYPRLAVPVDPARNYEIYKPPYFFDPAGRPTISDAPDKIFYANTFDITTPDAAAITEVRLLRNGSVTHMFDMDARMLELECIVKTGTTISVKAPQHPDLAPPGYYMLFIVKQGTNGPVPSVSKIVKLKGLTAAPPPQPA